jgi:hypothetical protein
MVWSLGVEHLVTRTTSLTAIPCTSTSPHIPARPLLHEYCTKCQGSGLVVLENVINRRPTTPTLTSQRILLTLVRMVVTSADMQTTAAANNQPLTSPVLIMLDPRRASLVDDAGSMRLESLCPSSVLGVANTQQPTPGPSPTGLPRDAAHPSEDTYATPSTDVPSPTPVAYLPQLPVGL